MLVILRKLMQSPSGRLQDSFPTGQFPDGHFPDRTIPTIPRLDTSATKASPTGHFPTKSFPRLDIFLTITYFQIFAFLANLFVKGDGLDFPLIFSWFIISSINFICPKFIYKRFNLLNIACQCSAIILP